MLFVVVLLLFVVIGCVLFSVVLVCCWSACFCVWLFVCVFFVAFSVLCCFRLVCVFVDCLLFVFSLMCLSFCCCCVCLWVFCV